MKKYDVIISRCVKRAQVVLEKLREEKLDGVVVPSKTGGYTFRIDFTISKDYQLLISVPADAMGNRGSDFNEPDIPATLETALWDVKKACLVCNKFEYDDVKRFDSISNLVKEIQRVKQALSKKNKD